MAKLQQAFNFVGHDQGYPTLYVNKIVDNQYVHTFFPLLSRAVGIPVIQKS
jgi:hypothetical protein